MLKIYLDSQDYSILSNEKVTDELQRTKDKLMSFSESGQVQFFFSSLIFCEIAPTQPSAVSHAIRRGDLLSSLCGNNALIDAGSLLYEEIESLKSLGEHRFSPYEIDGKWFPKIEIERPPSLENQFSEVLTEEAKTHGISRQVRRAIERKISKMGGLRTSLETLSPKSLNEQIIQEICKKYPMKPQSAELLRRYIVGEGTKEEAEKALEDSLRDPCWLMRWFAENPNLAHPLTEIIRRPGRAMGVQSRELVNSLAVLRKELENSRDTCAAKELISRMNWNTLATSMLVKSATRLIEGDGKLVQPSISAENIKKHCPGFDAMARSLASSVWDNIGGSRKELPSDSQFPDSMHAIYGPYVDIFRADAFMAPHIRSQVERHGTTVVSKLSQLPIAIENRLSKN